MMCVGVLNFFLSGGNIEIHPVQNYSSNISLKSSFHLFSIFCKRAVGLSSRRTIDMHFTVKCFVCDFLCVYVIILRIHWLRCSNDEMNFKENNL